MTDDFAAFRTPGGPFHLGQYAPTDTNGSGVEGAVSAAEEAVEPNLGQIPTYPTDALPEAARALVRYGEEQGLPTTLMAGAALAAIAAAIGSNVEIEIDTSWHERAILWVALLAARGAGKSPALRLGFAPLREHDERLPPDIGDVGAILLGDQTFEALARSLAAMEGR
jgi:Protein of unknown function (DUF3987)